MRAVWAIVVLLILGLMTLNVILSMGGVRSAAQASQLYDEVTAAAAVLTCLTVVFWYAGSGGPRQPERAGYAAPLPAQPERQTVSEEGGWPK